jgi:hypothetical protein
MKNMLISLIVSFLFILFLGLELHAGKGFFSCCCCCDDDDVVKYATIITTPLLPACSKI